MNDKTEKPKQQREPIKVDRVCCGHRNQQGDLLEVGIVFPFDQIKMMWLMDSKIVIIPQYMKDELIEKLSRL